MKPENAKSIIFIVDDDPTNLHVLVDALSHENVTVSAAKSGEEALKQVEKVNPDIILLDVLMPGIDGFETCRRLKENETTTEIPIIFMTALADTVNTVTGFEVGGVDYITKPFQVEDLLARVNAHLTIRKQQQHIRKQNEQLKELNATKDKFFSLIAHDLRNPLVGFLSFAHIIEHLEDMGKDQSQELTRQFRESAENLFALLENLLAWSRIQRGILEYLPQQINIGAIAARNVKLLTLNAEQKQITLSNSSQAEIPVYADFNMLDTVIRNLLSNALKFTKRGGTVTISATYDENAVMVSVSDTGMGIAEEKLPNLFRIDAKTQREGTDDEKGTGLGLILCKEFVERQGGSIWVESKVGKGSCFTVSLPRKEVGTSDEDKNWIVEK